MGTSMQTQLFISISIFIGFRIKFKPEILPQERNHSTTIAFCKRPTANCCARVRKRKQCGQYNNSLEEIAIHFFPFSSSTLRYVEKDIGILISEDPFTVRLKFEPAGRAVGETGEYYRTPKSNQCVVCGESEKYIRKNVVPREYRKYFPCKHFQFQFV